MAYIKTNWIDNATMLDDDALNKIENGIGALDTDKADKAENVSLKFPPSPLVGAKGDSNGTTGNGTDDTIAINNIITYCVTNKKKLFIPDGIFRITSTIIFTCEVSGNSPNTSIIFNDSTSDGVKIESNHYYSIYSNFGVLGKINSGNGIVLETNTSYIHLINVHSKYNGLHGLYSHSSWANTYTNCDFFQNGGLGVYCMSLTADPGLTNATMFLNCKSRFNGGTNTVTTDADLKGGVKIVSAQGCYWIGGVVESNNAWGFIIGGSLGGGVGTYGVQIQNVYMENNPNGATVGGNVKVINGYWTNVSVSKSWLAYGADTGKTGYCFYVATSASNGIFKEEDNRFVKLGTGTGTKYQGFTNALPKKNVSAIMMNQANASDLVTTIATIASGAVFMLTGTITMKRNSDNTGATYPFIASQLEGSTLNVSLGAAIVGTTTAPPTIAWVGNDLQVTLQEYCWGHVEIVDQILIPLADSASITLGTIFGDVMQRR